MTGFRVAPAGAQGLYGIAPGPDHAGQGDRRRHAGRRRSAASATIMEKLAPLGAGVPGGHAVGQSGRGGGRAGDARSRSRRRASTTARRANPQLTDGLAAAPRRRRRAVRGAIDRRHVRPLFHATPCRTRFAEVMACDTAALQPLLPPPARCRRVPRAVRLRSRLRFGGAHRGRHPGPRWSLPRRPFDRPAEAMRRRLTPCDRV